MGQDEGGVKDATRNLNWIYAQRGKADKAPNRKEAQAALKALEKAAERCDATSWEEAMQTLMEYPAYTRKEFSSMADKVAKTDKKIERFLVELGVVAESAGNAG